MQYSQLVLFCQFDNLFSPLQFQHALDVIVAANEEDGHGRLEAGGGGDARVDVAVPLHGHDVHVPGAAHVQLAHGATGPRAGHGDLVDGVVPVELEVVEDAVRAVADGGPDGELLLRVDHLIRAVPQEEFRVDAPGGAGHDELRPEFFQEGRGLEGALEIIADGDDGEVEIRDAERFEKGAVRAVPDEPAGEVRERHVHALLHALHSEHLMMELPEFFRDVPAVAAQPDEKYRFHKSSCGKSADGHVLFREPRREGAGVAVRRVDEGERPHAAEEHKRHEHAPGEVPRLSGNADGEAHGADGGHPFEEAVQEGEALPVADEKAPREEQDEVHEENRERLPDGFRREPPAEALHVAPEPEGGGRRREERVEGGGLDAARGGARSAADEHEDDEEHPPRFGHGGEVHGVESRGARRDGLEERREDPRAAGEAREVESVEGRCGDRDEAGRGGEDHLRLETAPGEPAPAGEEIRPGDEA